MIINGDCLEEMKKFPDNHFNCVLTDPPYGLHFMGKDWDHFKKSNHDENGNHKHLENASIYNRKCNVRKIMTGNSLAGSYDVKRDDEFQEFIFQIGKELLRISKPGTPLLMFGAPRRHHRQMSALEDAGWEIRDCLMWVFGQGFPKSHNHFGFEGYGTALKPAYEPIILAMKPLEGTFAQNANKWGVAGINIDVCRIGTEEIKTCAKQKGQSFTHLGKGERYNGCPESIHKGRWPANIIFDEEAAKQLDEMSGILNPLGNKKQSLGTEIYGSKINTINQPGVNCYPGEYGKGFSRFFYCAKASSSERNATSENKNNHPTVKPIKLMEYLLKLIAPPKNALVLDPFLGSGTTLVAAKNLGINAIGIELSEEYCKIAKQRVDYVEKNIFNYEMKEHTA